MILVSFFSVCRGCLPGIFAVVFFFAGSVPAAFVSDRMTVAVTGSGPEVILVPGFACSAEVWRPLEQRLAATRRVHLVQAAGFAGAAWKHQGEYLQPLVRELARYVREEKLRNPAIIGHSMGGLAALLVAQQNEGLLGQVMTVDSLPCFSAIGGVRLTPEQMQEQAKRSADAILAVDEAVFRAGQEHTALRMSRNMATRKAMIAWAMNSDRRALAAALRDVVATDARPGLYAMKTPVWAVYAADADGGVSRSVADALWSREYAALKTVRLVRVDDSRHFIMADQPERFAEVMRQFLEE